jgi:hypothetical protein
MWIFLVLQDLTVFALLSMAFWCPAFKRRHVRMSFKVAFLTFSIEADD